MRKLIIILFCLLGLKLSAVTYYVATTGTDGAYPTRGTLASPFLTLQYGINYLREGDTLFIRGGVYSLTTYLDIYGYNGTEANPICVFAYPTDYNAGIKPIFDLSAINPTAGSGAGFWIHDIDWWIFKGLTARNLKQYYKYGEWQPARGFSAARCSNVVFRNCVSHNQNGGGFRADQSGKISFYNCDVYNCCDTLSSIPGNGSNGFSAIGAYSEPDTSKWLEVYYYGCRSWHNADGGFSSAYGIKKYVADSCWAFSNGYLSGAGGGFRLGLLQAYMPPEDNFIIKHCMSVYNYYGYRINSNGTPYLNSFRWYNNTAGYNTRTGFEGQYQTTPQGGTPIFRNNLAYPFDLQIAYSDNNSAYSIEPGMNEIHDHNSWDLMVLTASDFISLDSTGITADRQLDGSLPNNACYNFFMKLSDASQAIDQGTDTISAAIVIGAADYSGDEPDLGYYETLLGDPPTSPYIATAPASNIGIRQAISGGTVTNDGGSPVTERGICWATTNNPTIADNYSADEGTGEGAYNVTLTGLKAKTKYWIKAYATNGLAAYGDTVSFTTPDWAIGWYGGKAAYYKGKIGIVK